jgi:hypothetical protein
MKIFKFKNSRIFYGSFLLVIGGVLFMIPVLPFGYVFLFIGGYLLADRIPIFQRFKRWLKRRDSKDRLEKVEYKLNEFFGEEKETEQSQAEES